MYSVLVERWQTGKNRDGSVYSTEQWIYLNDHICLIIHFQKFEETQPLQSLYKELVLT